jgi:hypothetical protein
MSICCPGFHHDGYAGSFMIAIHPDKKFIAIKNDGISPEPAFATLVLDSHVIFRLSRSSLFSWRA